MEGDGYLGVTCLSIQKGRLRCLSAGFFTGGRVLFFTSRPRGARFLSYTTATGYDARNCLSLGLGASGNLVDEDGTVLIKTEFDYSSPKCIPSLMGIKPATGSRGDVSAWHNWSNGMWTLKIKRARNTGSDDDVQFTEIGKSYWFSVGIMDAAAIAHALPGGHAGTPYRVILAQ